MIDRGLRPTLAWAFQRFVQRWRAAAALVILVRLLQVTIFAPLLGAVLRLFLLRWGRASIGNFEIAAFLLSPTGVAALLTVGTLFLATQYFEVASLLRILATDRLPWWRSLRSSTGMLHRLAYLGLLQLAIYVALAVPFVAGIALAYWWFWSESDLNGLIILRPPHFWQGAVIAVVLTIVYLVLAATWFLRWLYAVPILCLEPPQRVLAVLRESGRRARGTYFSAAAALSGWFVLQAGLAFLALGLIRWLLLQLLPGGETSLTQAWMIGAVAIFVHAAATAALTIFSSLTFSALILALYRRVSPGYLLAEAKLAIDTSEAAKTTPPWHHWLGTGAVALLALASLLAGPNLIADVDLADRVEITAHRAGAAFSPENSVAALQQAIAAGADWAEIDVQLTADAELVVLHDIDLARIGGGNRRVEQATLAEIQAIDIGSAIHSRFAGVRVPTLREMLTAANGKIGVNVELKPHNAADGQLLAERVVAEIARAGMIEQCRICSQSYASLQRVRELEPRLPIGLIMATAIGDPTRLPVDFLMVKSNLATQSFIERAHARKLRVHAWTVNNPANLASLIDAGVDNIITDDTSAIQAKLAEIESLNPIERLLIRVRHALH